MRELATFMEMKIEAGALTILAGDFNILRNKITEEFVAKVFGMNGGFVHHIDLIESEYGHLLGTLGQNLQVENLWERDN